MVVRASKNTRRNSLRTFLKHIMNSSLSHPCYEFWGTIEEVAETETSEEEREVHRLEETNGISVMRLIF